MPQVSNAPSDFPGATSDQPKVEAERASDTAEQQDALGMASNPESLPTMRATTTTTKTTIIVPAAELLPVAESAPLVLKKAAVPAAAAQLSQSPLLRKIRDGAPPFDAATPTCDIAAYPMPSIESGLPWVHDAFAVDAVLTKKRKNNNGGVGGGSAVATPHAFVLAHLHCPCILCAKDKETNTHNASCNAHKVTGKSGGSSRATHASRPIHSGRSPTLRARL